MEKDVHQAYLMRFSGRIIRGYEAYSLWKCLKFYSLNPLEVGHDEAEKNAETLSHYSTIPATIFFALETAFIIELAKFFDKRKEALRLVVGGTTRAGIGHDSIPNEDRARIEELVHQNEATIGHVNTLRSCLIAHDKRDSPETNWRLPSVNDLDRLFDSVREIHNLISKHTTGAYWVWPDADGSEMRLVVGELLANLETGQLQRQKEWEEKRLEH